MICSGPQARSGTRAGLVGRSSGATQSGGPFLAPPTLPGGGASLCEAPRSPFRDQIVWPVSLDRSDPAVAKGSASRNQLQDPGRPARAARRLSAQSGLLLRETPRCDVRTCTFSFVAKSQVKGAVQIRGGSKCARRCSFHTSEHHHWPLYRGLHRQLSQWTGRDFSKPSRASMRRAQA